MAPVREFLLQFTNLKNAGRLKKFFRAKVTFRFEKGNFTVKTIETKAELDQVMRLRYEVFHREFRNKKFPYGLDSDEYDHAADHLIIKDNSTDKIVGTYRLICSKFTDKFYSSSEFTTQTFLALPGNKLEMSRACIHRDYRKGVVMTLLWRGLVEYIQQVGAKYLFGCGSVKTMDPREIRLVTDYLHHEGYMSPSFHAVPLPQYELDVSHDGSLISGYEYQPDVAKKLVPALLNSYLRAGAKVAPVPALDRDFHCIDFFTVLDLSQITKSYEQKFTS